MDTSRLRQEISLCFSRLAKLKDELSTRKPMARGTVYILRRKCGKENCRCQRGELHPQICLAWREGGKGYLRPLKRQTEIDRYKKLTGYHRRLRKARTKFIRLSKRIVELSNTLEEEMLRRGGRRR